MRPGKKSRENIFRSAALPLLARETRGIKKCAFWHAAIEQTLFIEAVKRGHYRGVRERTIQVLSNIAHVALAARPQNLHQFELETPERKLLRCVIAARDAVFEKADHFCERHSGECASGTRYS